MASIRSVFPLFAGVFLVLCTVEAKDSKSGDEQQEIPRVSAPMMQRLPKTAGVSLIQVQASSARGVSGQAPAEAAKGGDAAPAAAAKKEAGAPAKEAGADAKAAGAGKEEAAGAAGAVPEAPMRGDYAKIAPFGKEDTSKELQDHAARTQDTLVDAVENAEVAEIKRAVFRALTRLR